MKNKKRKTFSDQIRDAINDFPLSRYRICQATDIDQASLSRFMSGKKGLQLSNLDKLAEFLGLEVVVREDRVDG